MTTSEFLAERRTGIGGSDIHHVFNLDPWGCSKRLWFEKRGAEADDPQETLAVMTRGTKLEPLVAEEYAEKTQRLIHEGPMARHKDFPCFIVHVDRYVTPINTPFDGKVPPDSFGTLECKTAGRENFFKIKREGLPAAYVLQLQHAMFVTGAVWGSFAVLWPDGWQLLWWDEERDEELCRRIRDEALKFWALVENGPAPDALPPDDARCSGCPYHYTCQGEAAVKAARLGSAATETDPTIAPLVREFLETRQLRDEAENIHNGVVEQLKTTLGDRTTVQVPGVGKLLYTYNREWDTKALEAERPEVAAKFRTKWDLTALGKAHPELEEHYKRPGLTRPLRVFPTKER